MNPKFYRTFPTTGTVRVMPRKVERAIWTDFQSEFQQDMLGRQFVDIDLEWVTVRRTPCPWDAGIDIYRVTVDEDEEVIYLERTYGRDKHPALRAYTADGDRIF